MKGHKAHDDDHCSRVEASGAKTSHCATNNEGYRIGSSPTYCRPDLEDANGAEENPLVVVESVDSAHDQLEGASSEQVGAGVPSNVVERVELIRDCGNGRRDDCAILFPD